MPVSWAADEEEAEPRLWAYERQSGEWSSAPATIGIAAPVAPGEKGGGERFAYLVQSADARPLTDDLCHRVITALTQGYCNARGAPNGTVEQALFEGLRAANEALFSHNVRADADSRLLLGAACVVLCGSSLYLARMGPACIWTLTDTATAQFPLRSLWYTLASESVSDINDEPPLGLRLDAEPETAVIASAAGATVMLISQTLRRRAQPTELQRLFAGGDDALTRAMLEDMAEGRDLSLLALAVPTHGQSFAGETIDAVPWGASDAAHGVVSEPAAAAPTPPSETPISTSAPQSSIVSSPTTTRSSTATETGPSPALHRARTAATVPAASWYSVEDNDLDEADSDVVDEEERQPNPPVAAQTREHIDFTDRAERAAESARRAVRKGARRVRNGAEDALLKVLPDRLPERPEPQPDRMPTISSTSQSLVVIAVLLPLLVLFTVIMVRVQYNRELDARRGSIHQTALSEYDKAINAASPELRADGLYRTMELVDAGLAILPQDELLIDLRMRTTLKLDDVEKVERLFHFKRLDSYTVGGTVINQPSRVAIYDKQALVLNKGAGQVYAYTLSDVGDAVSSRAETQVVLRQGDKIGATTVGELVDLSYLAPTGSRTTGDFVVLDRDGTLWTLRENAFQAVPVGDSNTWVKPVAIGAYLGNLYVLDPLGGTILKYLPTNNAYTTPPFPYLSSTVTVDMLGAVDMAIDGNVYVLFADGTIHKFFEGEEKPFPMTGLPSRIKNPTSIFVSGPQEPEADGYIYVTDRGNERIVQFDKKGNYIRSFKANTSEPYLTALGSVFVDETTARMFIFSERQFVLVALPPLAGK